MDFLLQHVIPYILVYKYVALFVLSFFSAFFLPFPSGSLLMASAAFVSDGVFDFKTIVVILIAANLLGDTAGYWVARIYGERIFSFIGFRKLFESKTFNLVEKKFRQHPGFVVFASRFEVLATLTVNILAGLSKVPYKKFLIYESTGTVAQVLFYAVIGYTFGYNWQYANSVIGKAFLIIGLVLVLLVISRREKIMAYLRKPDSLTE